jgi:hypothetical protein
MKRPFNNLWQSLCEIDWGNEGDPEAYFVTYGLSVAGTILLFFLFDVLFKRVGFIWLVGLVCCFMCGVVYIVFSIEDHQSAKWKRAFEEAQEWNPPIVYSDNNFVDDAGLGDNHL